MRNLNAPSILLAAASLATLVLLGAPGCSELPEIAPSVCGNGVTEAGEDCDSYARSPQQCRKPGQTGECRFDCSTYESGNGPRCPAGWGCGADRICRSPAGTFLTPAQALPVESRRVLLGDFDGDRHADILALGRSNEIGQAHFHAMFVESDGSLASSFAPDILIATPAIADLDRDGRDDLALNAFMGVGLLAGKADRTLAPVPYPLVNLPVQTRTRMLRVNGYQGHPLKQGVLAFFSDGTRHSLVSVENFSEAIATLPFPVGRIAGEPVAADVHSGDVSPCDEVMIADTAGPSVYGFEPCGPDGLWKSGPGEFAPLVTLPDDHATVGGVLAFDMNGDGLQDLLIGDENDEPWISFGCGDGEFCALPPESGSSLPGGAMRLARIVDSSCAESTLPDPRFPLAVGHLDADTAPDLVSPTELFLGKELRIDVGGRRAVLLGCPANERFSGQWSLARIADINRDGLSDVIAASYDSLDVQVLTGTGLDRLNWFTVATRAPVTRLEIGDFDGDLVSDIAMGESGFEEVYPVAERGDHLTIAFGEAFGPPTAAVDVGRFHAIHQMSAARYDSGDAVDEIGVVSTSKDGESETITVLIGSPDRRPFSAYGLHVIQDEGGHPREYAGTPWTLTLGGFTLKQPKDLVAYATDSVCVSLLDCTARLWLVPSGEDGLGRPSPSSPLPAEIAPLQVSTLGTTPVVTMHLVAGDVDGDGLDEILIVAPKGQDGPTTLWVSAPPRDGGSWLGQSEIVRELSHTELGIVPESAPALADFDGDGLIDLALILSQDDGTALLAMAWNDGAGGLDLGNATLLSAPEGGLTAMAVVEADTDPAFELAMLTDSGAWLVQQGAPQARQFLVGPLPGVNGGVSIASGDVTGDGVADLVVGSGETLRIHAGEAVLP